MPGRDGTGPIVSRRGHGCQSRNGVGNGRMRNPINEFSEFCECPLCGIKVKHQRGEPCTKIKCPQCGSSMVRT